MSNRSDLYTIHDKKIRTYSDFKLDFSKNPLTGFLAKVTNEESLKQSIRNLILTERTERFYQPHIGSKIWSLLFEPIDVMTEDMLRTTIRETIENNEPRVNLHSVAVEARPEYNAYFISIMFSAKNIPEKMVEMSLILRRVR